jgi:non-specific serine/threonine protein kinase
MTAPPLPQPPPEAPAPAAVRRVGGIPLPTPPTLLLGRERELAAARDLLRADARLLTLTGPGGVGKSRLALAIAADTADDLEGGASLVDLAPLVDPGLVPAAVATALGVREGGAGSLLDGVVRALGRRELLLVLDNLEHLLPGAAGDVARLLEACPGLRLLVTSREPLRLRAEHLLPVPPLALPPRALWALSSPPSSPPSPAALLAYPAVALFVRRARAATAGFGLTEQNAAAVAELCTRLDGLPLAIELAAARARFLAPAAVLERLGGRLDLLLGRAADAPARHRTLRAALDWSHDLLTAQEQAVFRRLAVFAGGFTQEAAAAVAGAAAAWPDASSLPDGQSLLEPLAEKSLLLAGPAEGDGRDGGQSGDAPEVRFGMLETVRAYALERLEASGEGEAARRRHAAYYLALARPAAPEIRGPRHARWLDRLEAEHDNLRQALRWALEGGSHEAALRLAAAAWPFWWRRGHLGEGLGWLEAALARGDGAPAALRAPALSGAGMLAWARGDQELAQARHEAALALYRANADEAGVASALRDLALVARHRGDVAQAAALAGEGLALARRWGDAWVVATILPVLAVLEHDRGTPAEAAPYLEESLALFRAAGDSWGTALTLADLALVARARGDPAGAAALLGESLALRRDLADRPGIAGCLERLALVAADLGDAPRAARLFGAAEALREAVGAPLAAPTVAPGTPADHDRALAALRAALGEPVLARLWAEGRAAPLEQAVADALAPAAPAAAPHPTPPDGLTPREREVAVLVAHGLTNRQIAARLVIATRTADAHVHNILGKLGFTTRAQVAAWAAAQGLLGDG